MNSGIDRNYIYIVNPQGDLGKIYFHWGVSILSITIIVNIWGPPPKKAQSYWKSVYPHNDVVKFTKNPYINIECMIVCIIQIWIWAFRQWSFWLKGLSKFIYIYSINSIFTLNFYITIETVFYIIIIW